MGHFPWLQYTAVSLSVASVYTCFHWSTQGGLAGLKPPSSKRNKKKTHCVGMMLSKFLRDLRFSLNQPLKLADDWYTGILKHINKTYKHVDYILCQVVLIFTVI
jgi:hypothetical protein